MFNYNKINNERCFGIIHNESNFVTLVKLAENIGDSSHSVALSGVYYM